jgi:hypothetical protein
MTRIQLISDQLGTVSGYLDLKENIPLPITFSVAEIRNLQERNGSFSKSIKIPGSKVGNILLNNYYEVNISTGQFNLNKLQRCIVIQDGAVIIDNALLQLVSVETKNIGTDQEHIEYTVLIKVTASDFFTIINQKNLKDINLTKYNELLTSTNIINTFNNDYTDAYKYVMPTAGDTNYDLFEWQPGFYARFYWDKIMEQSGFTYEWPEQLDMQFNKLILPYHGDKPKGSADQVPELTVIADRSTEYLSSSTQVYAGGAGIPFSFNLAYPNIDNEILDQYNRYNPATYTYSSPTYTSGNGALVIEYELEYELIFNNPTAGNLTLKEPLSNGTNTNFRIRPTISQIKNGTTLTSNILNIEDKIIYGGTVLTPGDNVISSGFKVLSTAFNSVNLNDTFTERMTMRINNQLFATWKNGSNVATSVGVKLKLTSIRKTIKVSIQNIGFNSLLIMNNYIPNMKQSEFIKSIIGMYNLYIDVDKTNPNKLLIKSRDKYYDDGKIENWHKKWMRQMPTTLQFLPQLASKKLVLTYKEDKDIPNVGYKDNVGEIYGQLEYTFDNEYVKNSTKQEISFGPSPLGRESFGAYTTIINGAQPKTLPRILYDGGVKTCGNYSITNYPGSVANLTTYPYTGHLDDPLNPTFDINYGICDYYFDYNIGITNNNLTNKYWLRTLGQINEGKMMTAYFRLTALDIQKLELNQKVFVDNAYWIINKIIDYDANSNNPTKVELMSADAYIKLPKFGRTIRPPKPLPIKPIKPIKGDVIVKPIRDIKNEIYKQKNINLSSHDILIHGEGNNVGENTKGGVILGNNNNINDTSSMIIGDNITATEDGYFIGDYALTENGLIRTDKIVIDGGFNTILPIDKTNYIDVIDGGFNSVRNFGGDSKERPIIDGNDKV